MPSPRVKILKLLQLLAQNRMGLDKRDIGQRLKMSIRTVERYLDELREAGFLIVADGNPDDGVALRFRLDREDFTGLPHEMPPLDLSFQETVAVVASLEAATLPHSKWLDEARKSAADKLSIYLPGSQGRRIPFFRSGLLQVGPDNARIEEIKKHVFQDLMEGAISRRVVEIVYPWKSIAKGEKANSTGKRWRKIHPLGFLLAHGGLYCVAWIHAHKENRVLNLARVSASRILTEEFLTAEVNPLRKYKEGSFNLWTEKPEKIAIRFSPDSAHAIRSRKIHSSQRIEEKKDGSIILHLKVGGRIELIWWLLQWGEEAELLEPKEMRKSLEAMLHSMAQKYA